MTRIAVEWLQRLFRFRARPQVIRLGGDTPSSTIEPVRGFSAANGKVLRPRVQ